MVLHVSEQFTYFDLIGPSAYDPVLACSRDLRPPRGMGRRLGGWAAAERKGRLWHRVLRTARAELYRQIPGSNQRIGCSY